jgi:hypothetical protein
VETLGADINDMDMGLRMWGGGAWLTMWLRHELTSCLYVNLTPSMTYNNLILFVLQGFSLKSDSFES